MKQIVTATLICMICQAVPSIIDYSLGIEFTGSIRFIHTMAWFIAGGIAFILVGYFVREK